jgi:hypothetical protein
MPFPRLVRVSLLGRKIWDGEFVAPHRQTGMGNARAKPKKLYKKLS